MNEAIIAIHLAATLFMTGIVWFVQIVHYPLFKFIPKNDYGNYERQHQRYTTLLVGPAMLIEVLSGAWIAYAVREYLDNPLFWAAGAFLIIVWLSTALLQVPCHQQLLEKFDTKTHKKLIRSNWVRTISWSLRSLFLILMVI